ncbi:MAG: hypothetical protein OXI01_08835 [Albidovulum sp.]|nr:hypothetical protein [Albidovulum sp.]
MLLNLLQTGVPSQLSNADPITPEGRQAIAQRDLERQIQAAASRGRDVIERKSEPTGNG